MHSFVARLRGRAISQSTAVSVQTEEPPPPTPDTSTLPHPAQPDPSVSGHHAALDRKILPQVNELLESYSAVEDNTSSGLSPRPVKQRSRTEHTPFSGEQVETDDLSSNLRLGSPSHPQARSMRVSSSGFSRISRRIAASGPWSTFGRSKDPTAPRLSQLEYPPSSRRFHFGSVDTFAIPRRSRSSRSVTAFTVDSSISADRTRQPSRASESSSWMQPQSNMSSHRRSLSLCQINIEEPVVQQLNGSSPPTTSSRKASTKRSITTQSSFSAHTVHTPMQVLDVNTRSGSPHTFGGESPPPRLSALISSASPIPPIPTLESGFSQAPSSELVIRDLSNNAQRQLSRHWTTLRAKTYPPRRRRRTIGGRPDENTVPFPLVNGRRLRQHASFPAVQHLFDVSQVYQHDTGSKSSRRSSADWNARQATAGVLSHSVGDYGWPAEVSKEIIQLSLSSDRARGKIRSRDTDVSAKADITSRVNNVPLSGEVVGRPQSPPFRPNLPSLSKEGVLELSLGCVQLTLNMTFQTYLKAETRDRAFLRPS